MKPEQLSLLRDVAKERNYGWGEEHAEQVSRLALKIYNELLRLGMLKEAAQDKELLNAAALLHDIGRPKEPHHEIAFRILSEEIPKRAGSYPLSKEELSVIVYCVLFHRGNRFVKRKEVPLTQPSRTKRLAAILRIADGLDYGPPFDAPVKEISLKIQDGAIVCRVESRSKEVKNRVKNYCNHTRTEKVNLFKEMFVSNMTFELADC